MSNVKCRKVDISAKLRYLRISPRKVRVVSDLVRGLDVEAAKKQLQFSGKRAAPKIGKLLDSAVSNAKNNFSKDESGLFIKKILIDEGPSYKRFRPTGRGHAAPIAKRTSHVTIVLDERAGKAPQEITKKAG